MLMTLQFRVGAVTVLDPLSFLIGRGLHLLEASLAEFFEFAVVGVEEGVVAGDFGLDGLFLGLG